MDNQPFHLDIENINGLTIATPVGEIDLSKSSELRTALHPLIEAKPKSIVVDLKHVPYMDSSGIATLIEALQLSKMSSINFSLCSLSDGVRSIIELARLDQIFHIYDNREQAIG